MFRQQLLFPSEEFILQVSQHRRRVGLAQFQPCIRGQVFAAVFHGIQRTHQLDRIPRDLGSRLLGLYNLSARVRPAPGARDLVAGDHAVVAAIAIGQQDLPVIFLRKYFGPSRPRFSVKSKMLYGPASSPT